jgi:adenine-specific DNA methylase
MHNKRRFIAESFPVKEVGEASAREKNICHGHISTLHIWWARHPAFEEGKIIRKIPYDLEE